MLLITVVILVKNYLLRHLYVDGKKLDNWVFLDSARVSFKEFDDLVYVFKDVGDKVGLRINADPEYIEFDARDLRRFDELFEDVVKRSKPEMIMVCLSMKDNQIYDRIKTLGDNKFHVPTQCVQKRTLFKQGRVNDQVRKTVLLYHFHILECQIKQSNYQRLNILISFRHISIIHIDDWIVIR